MTTEEPDSLSIGLWGAEITARFELTAAADPRIFARELPGLSRLVRGIEGIEFAGDSDIEKLLLASIEFADTCQPESAFRIARANRAAARGFLLLGQQPDAADIEQIALGNLGTTTLFGDKRFRDSWAAILYDRVSNPGNHTTPNERTGRRHRKEAARELVDAVALFVGSLIDDRAESTVSEAKALEHAREPLLSSTRGLTNIERDRASIRRARSIAVGVIAVVILAGALVVLRPSLFSSACSSATSKCLQPQATPGSKATTSALSDPVWTPASLRFPSGCKGDGPASSSTEPVELEFQQPGDCWSPSSRFDPSQPVNLLIEWINLTGKEATNVSTYLAVPKGLSLLPATTYYGNSTFRDGLLTQFGSLTKTGLNFGNYDSGANVWVIARVSVSKSVADACGLHGYKFTVKVASDQDRADGAISESKPVIFFYRNC